MPGDVPGDVPGDGAEAVLAGGSIAAIRQAYAERAFSVREAVGWYLARIDALSRRGPCLNAVRETATSALEDAARADAEIGAGRALGPLHGIPVLLKDNILTADGMAATAGAAALRGFVPRREATLVRRLRAAGAIILGKTNMTEFADYVSDVMPSEFSGAGGVVRNPHGVRFGRGQGSSVGSAASVAAALAPVAIGSETQNSLQTPACCTGVTAWKPSVGLVSRSGVVPLVPSQDTAGPLTRTVADAALLAAVLAGPDSRDTATLQRPWTGWEPFRRRELHGLRIAVPRLTMTDREDVAAVMPLFEDLLSRLAAAGAVVIDPCDLPGAEQLRDVRSTVFPTEFKAGLDAFLEDHGAPCGIGSLAELIAWNAAHPEAIPYGQSLLEAAARSAGLDDPGYRADRARDIALSRMAGIDAALAASGADVLMAPMGAAARCTGKAGAPVVALPVAEGPGGTPFGITLYAAPGQDCRLLAAAAAVERAVARPWTPAVS